MVVLVDRDTSMLNGSHDDMSANCLFRQEASCSGWKQQSSRLTE